ncbi:MAG: hypothetical protein AB8I80_09865, partial [Anaerolineae bacterium]
DETTIYRPDVLPEGRGTIAEEYLHHLETGEALHPTLQMDNNLEYMAILDAGLRSTMSGQLELVDSAAWQMG